MTASSARRQLRTHQLVEVGEVLKPAGSVLYPAEFVTGDGISAFGRTISNFVAFPFRRHRLKRSGWLVHDNSWELDTGLTKSKLYFISGISRRVNCGFRDISGYLLNCKGYALSNGFDRAASNLCYCCNPQV